MKTFFKAVLVFAILAVAIVILNTLTKPRDPVPPASLGTEGEATTTPLTAVSDLPVSFQSIREQASSSPAVSVEYPQFPTLSKEFNTAVKQSVLDELARFKEDAKNALNSDPEDLAFSSKWTPVQMNDKYVSFIIRYEFYAGGAHEGQLLRTFNYDVAGKRILALGDLFASDTDYLTFLSNESRKQLMAKFETDPDTTLLEGTRPVLENFRNFTFKDGAVTIYFPAYAVAPWAAGEQQISVPIGSVR